MRIVRAAEWTYLDTTINKSLRHTSSKTFHSLECHFDYLLILESHYCGNDEIQNCTTNSSKDTDSNVIDAKFLCSLCICFCSNSSGLDNGETIFDSHSCSKVISNHCPITVLGINKAGNLIASGVITNDGNQINRKLCGRRAFELIANSRLDNSHDFLIGHSLSPFILLLNFQPQYGYLRERPPFAHSLTRRTPCGRIKRF